MAELKTFLFTDIVRSVDLKRQMPGRSDAERDQAFIREVLMPHRQRIEQTLAEHGGRVVSTAGDGHFLVFSDTLLAAHWAVATQQSHRDDPIRTPGGGQVEVRISMHLGIPQLDPHDPNNFVGKPVDYAARLSDYATGGQILASRSVVAVLEDAGLDGVEFHRHGGRELKGIGRVEVFELLYDGQGPHTMRVQPREAYSRQWTVLPATMGLTEFYGAGSREQAAGSGQRAAGGTGDANTGFMAGGPATDVVPLRLGNYELEGRLGIGGMGDVYRARHVQFGRLRAVKVIKPHFVEGGHREVIDRFYREIKAVGALEHPNIVVAIDSSSPSDSVHYLVMEFIDGVGTDELVARHGPLPVAEACEIARQAARGLAYIHHHAMVHRDVKPSNLMVTVARRDEEQGARSREPGVGSNAKPQSADAVVKILDLGLALLVDDEQQRLTLLDNRPMGTAMYMSPEQWKTTSVDIRADIYSLGCTLYHLLSGKPPFWESDLRPEKAHQRERLPAIAAQAIPRALWTVLEKMTAKEPADRYADPAEVAAALAPLAEGHQLARLVREVTPHRPGAATQGFARSDTQVAQGAESDTRLARSRPGWRLPKSFPPVPRRRLRFGAMAALVLVGLVAAGWAGLEAWNQQSRRALEVSANFAASAILGEINGRFTRLNEVARDRDLREWMLALETATGDDQRESLQRDIERWLGTKRSNSPGQLWGESWFVNDRSGVQIARSPQSSRSTGRNYAHRDYFHGQGHDLPEGGTDGLVPIETSHLSAVYRSTSDGTLRVAFSVPIENGRSGREREVIGVLAMSVDLGDFDVLEERLPPGYEVVLVDLREQTIADQRRRGLVLHHQARDEQRVDQPPPWVSEALLARIDQMLAAHRPRPGDALMLSDYRDAVVTRSDRYWGAMQPVVDTQPDRDVRDTGWLVLVQERLGR